MLLRKRTRLIILAGLLALAGVALAAVLILRAQRPLDLFRRASEAGFGVNVLTPPYHVTGFAVIADGDPAFRHWLLSIVENPKEDWGLRHEALAALLNMRNDAALADAMRDLLDWIDEHHELKGQDSFVILMEKDLWYMALHSGVPEPELIEILKRVYPDKWRSLLVGRARVADEELKQQGESSRRVTTRAKQLLKYLGESEKGEEPACSPAPTPQSPAPDPSAPAPP